MASSSSSKPAVVKGAAVSNNNAGEGEEDVDLDVSTNKGEVSGPIDYNALVLKEETKRVVESLRSRSAVARAKKVGEEAKEALDDCVTRTLDAAKDALKKGQSGNEEEVGNLLRKALDGMALNHLDNATFISALERTSDALAAKWGKEEVDIPAEVQKAFEDAVAARNPDALKKSAVHRKIEMGFAKATEEDDVAVEGENEDDAALKWRDPISLEEVNNPVKHKVCKHIVNRTSLSLLKAKDMKCPYRGCPQKWGTGSYEDATEFAAQFERAKRRREKKGASSSTAKKARNAAVVDDIEE